MRASSTRATLTAGQRAQGLAEHPVGQPEARRDLRRLGLGGEAAGRVQLGVGLRVPAHRPVAGTVVGAAHLLLGLAQPAYDFVQAAGRQDPVAGQDVEVAGARVLRQVADTAGAGHLAPGRQRLAGQDPGQRGLAGTVAADQADLVAGTDPERRVVDEDAGARADMQVASGDHGGVCFLGATGERRRRCVSGCRIRLQAQEARRRTDIGWLVPDSGGRKGVR